MRWILGLVGGLSGLVAAGLALGQASSLRFAVANLPVHGFPGEVRRDVVFDPRTGQSLDLYLPPEPGPHPVLVFLYGGRWSYGRKEDYAFVGTLFARHGYATVIPDYRKWPEARFPAFVEDAAAAVGWAAETLGAGNGRARLFVAGHSAGAHIGALLATDPGYLRPHGLAPGDLAGFAGLAGPYHFEPEADDLVAIFGPEERYPRMQAGTFVDGTEPPFLMLYGRADETVGVINVERMEAAFRDAGGCFATRLYDGIDHVGLVASLVWTHRGRRPVLGDMLDFLAAPRAVCAG